MAVKLQRSGTPCNLAGDRQPTFRKDLQITSSGKQGGPFQKLANAAIP